MLISNLSWLWDLVVWRLGLEIIWWVRLNKLSLLLSGLGLGKLEMTFFVLFSPTIIRQVTQRGSWAETGALSLNGSSPGGSVGFRAGSLIHTSVLIFIFSSILLAIFHIWILFSTVNFYEERTSLLTKWSVFMLSNTQRSWRRSGHSLTGTISP